MRGEKQTKIDASCLLLMALTCLIAGKIVACVPCPLVMAYLYAVERDGPHKWFRSKRAEFAAALFNQAHSH